MEKGSLFSMDREVTAEKLCFLTFQWRELCAVNSGFSKKSCLPASTSFSAVTAVLKDSSQKRELKRIREFLPLLSNWVFFTLKRREEKIFKNIKIKGDYANTTLD